MLLERTPKYIYSADFIIDTDGKSVKEIAECIGGFFDGEGKGNKVH